MSSYEEQGVCLTSLRLIGVLKAVYILVKEFTSLGYIFYTAYRYSPTWIENPKKPGFQNDDTDEPISEITQPQLLTFSTENTSGIAVHVTAVFCENT